MPSDLFALGSAGPLRPVQLMPALVEAERQVVGVGVGRQGEDDVGVEHAFVDDRGSGPSEPDLEVRNGSKAAIGVRPKSGCSSAAK